MDLALNPRMQMRRLLTVFSFLGMLILFTATYNLLLSSRAFAEPFVHILDGDSNYSSPGGFILPNELEFYRFNDVLQFKTGALVAVGSFRFFHDLSQGNFEAGIALDYDLKIASFNMGLIKVFLAAKNRREFLALLVGSPDEFLIELAQYEKGEISAKDLIYRTRVLIARQRGHYPFHKKFFSDQISSPLVQAFALKMVTFLANPKTSPDSFIGSDIHFNKVKWMIAEGKVIVVHGNLAGSTTFNRVANLLKNLRLTVSVLDISNAFQHISHSKLHLGPKRFLNNLKALNFSPDAVILSTYLQESRSARVGDGWTYFAFPHAIYMKAAETFITRHQKDPRPENSYRNFIRLKAHGYKQPEKAPLVLADIQRGDGGHPGDGYIPPNEKEFHRFIPILENRTGALIAVGTFRFFQNLSQGNFEVGIAFDYAPEVVDFNIGLRQVFLAATNRYDFIAQLSGKPEEALSLLRQFEQDKISGHELVSAARALHESQQNKVQHPLSSLFPDSINSHVISGFALNLFQFFADQKIRKTSFLGSDFHFNKVKALIQKGRVFVVNGNLAGTATLKKLGAQLRAQNFEISVLDISNSYKYIEEYRGIAPANFLSNLKALPFAKNAEILTTHGFGKDLRSSAASDGWTYFSFPFTTYIAGAEIFITEYYKKRTPERKHSHFMATTGLDYVLKTDRRICLFLF